MVVMDLVTEVPSDFLMAMTAGCTTLLILYPLKNLHPKVGALMMVMDFPVLEVLMVEIAVICCLLTC